MIEYLGYIGSVVFDNEAGILHGTVVNTRDVITFQGESVDEVRQAFHDSVDDYLEFCAQRHEEPEKPMSGKFNVRISPQLHAFAAATARSRDISLNALVELAIEQIVGRVDLEPLQVAQATNQVSNDVHAPILSDALPESLEEHDLTHKSQIDFPKTTETPIPATVPLLQGSVRLSTRKQHVNR